ncbi:MAG TPA: ComEA family DNA-binding protein [Thermomicrobiales bacterium]|nr:ComEA family DNA-binding protein [Thermomicrobiales bacterium]
MKPSTGVLLIVTAVVSVAVAIVTFVAVDRFMSPEIVVTPPEPHEITVAVTGAVATPGTVTVPGTARLQHVIEAAGGLTPSADVTSLNMAARVGDGEHVVIPELPDPGERFAIEEPTVARAGAEPGTRASSPEPEVLVDLNNASHSELEALPGIGPVLAERILAYRAEQGPFSSVEELEEVEGISTRTIEEIRPLVTIGE